MCQIHLAGGQPCQQFIRRQVDQRHFRSLIEYMIGQRFAHHDAGDLAHHIVQAFQMLHIQRGVDVDAGGQQFFHVLPAFAVA